MYLLDTHVFLWWVTSPRRLTAAQDKALLRAESRGEPLALSAISLWEVALLAVRDRFTPPKPIELWLPEIERDPSLSVLPVTGGIAIEAVRLGRQFPKDPADRIIVATARCHDLVLLTADERIRNSGRVPVL